MLSAVRALAGLPSAAEGTAGSRRTAWAAVGVHLDELSSLVLCLGLAGDTRTALGKMLASCREAGHPGVLTLRQLRCHDEPLVCVGGRPSAAMRRRNRRIEEELTLDALLQDLSPS